MQNDHRRDDGSNLEQELQDQRQGLSTLLKRDFSTASVKEMVAACRERLQQLDADDFEAAMLREFLVMLTGRSDGASLAH